MEDLVQKPARKGKGKKRAHPTEDEVSKSEQQRILPQRRFFAAY